MTHVRILLGGLANGRRLQTKQFQTRQSSIGLGKKSGTANTGKHGFIIDSHMNGPP